MSFLRRRTWLIWDEGKYILEAARVIKENNWSLDD